MPIGPTMLEARDAYLAADMMRFGGENQSELWLAFARRGFGKDATSTNGLSDENDADPKPDFQSLVHPNTTVTFKAIASDEMNAAVKARIYVGHYEARVSPIADTIPPPSPQTAAAKHPVRVTSITKPALRPARTSSSFERMATATCASAKRSRGVARQLTIKMPTNYASMSKGS